MQIVSDAMGREIVHYQAPESEMLNEEMNHFISWFNSMGDIDPVLKAGLAYLLVAKNMI